MCNKKCNTCIEKYNYKTAEPCRYCKWNTEEYWLKDINKMEKDNYRYTKDDKNLDIPF